MITKLFKVPCIPSPPDDRETWVEMGMAVKSGLGNQGFDLWDAWSRQSTSYRPADAKAVWRSIHPRTGGITLGTLFHLAKAHGWQGVWKPPKLTKDERQERARRAAEERRRREAADMALQIIQSSQWDTHPYLEAKGFPHQRGLVCSETIPHRGLPGRPPPPPWVLQGDLIVPMRHYSNNRLLTVQRIDAEGNKKFLSGGQAREAVLRIGPARPRERWFCEGFATALSLMAALDHLSRSRGSEVVVCFSDGTLRRVASRGYVVADHDQHICPKPPRGCSYRWSEPKAVPQYCPVCDEDKVLQAAGEKAAMATGLPYYLPPFVGDVNDVHARWGIPALARGIKSTLLEVG